MARSARTASPDASASKPACRKCFLAENLVMALSRAPVPTASKSSIAWLSLCMYSCTVQGSKKAHTQKRTCQPSRLHPLCPERALLEALLRWPCTCCQQLKHFLPCGAQMPPHTSPSPLADFRPSLALHQSSHIPELLARSAPKREVLEAQCRAGPRRRLHKACHVSSDQAQRGEKDARIGSTMRKHSAWDVKNVTLSCSRPNLRCEITKMWANCARHFVAISAKWASPASFQPQSSTQQRAHLNKTHIFTGIAIVGCCLHFLAPLNAFPARSYSSAARSCLSDDPKPKGDHLPISALACNTMCAGTRGL